MNDEELSAFERDPAVRSFPDLEAWARERLRRGDSGPIEFLRRLARVRVLMDRLRRIVERLDGATPAVVRRTDFLREELRDRLDVAHRRLEHARRLLRVGPHHRPLLVLLRNDVIVDRLVSHARFEAQERARLRATNRVQRRDELTRRGRPRSGPVVGHVWVPDPVSGQSCRNCGSAYGSGHRGDCPGPLMRICSTCDQPESAHPRRECPHGFNDVERIRERTGVRYFLDEAGRIVRAEVPRELRALSPEQLRSAMGFETPMDRP